MNLLTNGGTVEIHADAQYVTVRTGRGCARRRGHSVGKFSEFDAADTPGQSSLLSLEQNTECDREPEIEVGTMRIPIARGHSRHEAIQGPNGHSPIEIARGTCAGDDTMGG